MIIIKLKKYKSVSIPYFNKIYILKFRTNVCDDDILKIICNIHKKHQKALIEKNLKRFNYVKCCFKIAK